MPMIECWYKRIIIQVVNPVKEEWFLYKYETNNLLKYPKYIYIYTQHEIEPHNHNNKQKGL